MTTVSMRKAPGIAAGAFRSPRRRGTICFLALWLASSAGLAQPAGIHTSREGRVLPLPKEDGVFHFVIFGDRTGGPPEGVDVLRQAVTDTNLLDPDLVMTVGDMVQGYGKAEPWLEEMREYREIMARLRMPWFPVAGNHDIYWHGGGAPDGHHEKNFETHFGPLWYWFQHKGCGFLVLYTDEGDPVTGDRGYNKPSLNQMSPEQLSWLGKSLEAMRELDHVFAFLHHPRWIEERYRGTNWQEVHSLLAGAGNVRAVFAGHIHQMRYDGVKDGIEFYTLGTTGANFPFELQGAGWLHHLNIVTVRKDGIRVAALPVGATFDPRQFTPERHRDIDALRYFRPGELPPLAVGASGDVDQDFSLPITNPTGSPIEVTARLETDSARWVFAPDHQHVHLEAGASTELEWRLSRKPVGLDPLDVPELVLQVDYLVDGARISLPERRFSLPMTLAGPVPVAAAGDRVARALAPRGDGCLRVASSMLGPRHESFTVEAWVKLGKYRSHGTVLGKHASFTLSVDGGWPVFLVQLADGVGRVRANAKLELGRWHHLAGSYDGEDLRIYVDGSLRGRARRGGGRRHNGMPLFVGAEPNRQGAPRNFFDGWIDDVRLSAAARYTRSRFRPLRPLKPDATTRLLLHLDRSIGPFVLDASTQRAHALQSGKARLEVVP